MRFCFNVLSYRRRQRREQFVVRVYLGLVARASHPVLEKTEGTNDFVLL